jgi:hypothetical protein
VLLLLGFQQQLNFFERERMRTDNNAREKEGRLKFYFRELKSQA